MKRRSRRGFPGINFVLFVHRLKQVGEAADGFRRAQKQKPVRLERIMKSGQRLLLQTRLKINEEVATTDKVHARERRVADEILPGEDDHFAQWLDDAIAAFFLNKKTPQSFRRDILCEALGIETVAGFVQQCVVEVGGEHLELARAGSFLRSFGEGHGHRIRLLAGGTAEHPNAEWIVAALLEEFRK